MGASEARFTAVSAPTTVDASTYDARAQAAAERVHELEEALSDARTLRHQLIVDGIEAGFSWSHVAEANRCSQAMVHKALAAPRAS